MTALLALLALAQNPAWPASDPELSPAALSRTELMPADPWYAPDPRAPGGCGGQSALWSFVPSCMPNLTVAPGMSLDRAWLRTIGRPQVVIAVLDGGAEWTAQDLVARVALNPGELPAPMTSTVAGAHDANRDGGFTVLDYTSATGTVAPTVDRVRDVRLLARPDRGDTNGNGLLDPADLLAVFGDQRDDDNNGRVDDVAGWDALDDDADPRGPTASAPGQTAREAVAETNNGVDGAGACPLCLYLPVRVASASRAPSKALADGIRYAARRGAAIIAVPVTPTDFAGPAATHLAGALDEAERSGALIVAAHGRTGGRNTSSPFDPNRTVLVGGTRLDGETSSEATTAFRPDPCSSTGAALALVAPGTCSAGPSTQVAGALGLGIAAALGVDGPPLTPSLSPLELRALAVGASVHAEATERADWTPELGHGRLDARRLVDAVLRDEIPPGAVITAPLHTLAFDPTEADPVVITGRIENRRHQAVNWVIEYAIGLAPLGDAWVTLETGRFDTLGELEVRADLPTAALFRDPTEPPSAPTSHAITIRLTAVGERDSVQVPNQVRRLVFVERDLFTLPSFPLDLGASAAGSPRVLDIDDDGAEEILVATVDGRLHAIEATGEPVPGWPVEMPTIGAAPTVLEAGFAAGRITGTNAPYAIALTLPPRRVVLIEAQGALQAGFPVVATSTAGGAINGTPILYDLDLDGRLDVAVSLDDGSLHAWDASGAPINGFPIHLPESVGAPAVGDLDQDGIPELVVSSARTVFAQSARADGRFDRARWSLPPQPERAPLEDYVFGAPVPASAAPVLGDVDGDGQLEIVVAPPGFGAIVIDPRAESVIERSIARADLGPRAEVGAEGGPIHSLGGPLALADLDRDRGLDLVVGASTFEYLRGPSTAAAVEPLVAAFAFSGATAAVGGFPVDAGDRPRGGFLVVDLDGDRRPEVIFGDGQFRLHARSSAGVSPRGWPKSTGGAVKGTPAAGDLDSDGRLEVVAATDHGLLLAWRTEASARARLPWEGERHDHQATGNVSTPTTLRGVQESDESCECRGASSAPRSSGWLPFLALAVLGLARRRR